MVEIIPNFHPALVHFPIAFATAAVAFIAIAALFRNWSYAAQCLITGRWMLWGAALFALIAAVFGWFAFNSVAHDEVSHVATGKVSSIIREGVFNGRISKSVAAHLTNQTF